MVSRHCAYCLIPLEADKVKMCGGCKKRSYCSRDCQVNDWGAVGQHHKQWCKEQICEEDIDWEIRETVDGKGLGVFSKRLLPKHTRIMVDRGYRKIEDVPLPFINALMPHEGTLQEKWDLNSFYREESGDNLGIRLARVNHDCRNNATNKFITDLNAFILIAIRDIQEGEEISIQYHFYNDISTSKGYRDAREQVIREKWSVNCLESCICRDKVLAERIQKAHELDSMIPTMPMKTEEQIKRVLKNVDLLLKESEQISNGIMALSRTYYDGFQIAILHKKTYPLHKMYIQKYLESCEIVDSKLSSTYQQALKYYQNPSIHRNHF
ncbi:hypothetical protein DLAC_03396 [Tieghemostelium lacteum]|uniref:SET domain-containing protein n=1 Tax=Tieghemostelium lacteum TaxID=361077 RepID=A0A152A294_TIELA|nr:hypothetical protein DLAC_03396 [Tieghemostelium lacteum]|eukprot:KYR00237.1 hypothetical protein DLAC_03396 [Tieghemostelium lacteum]